MRKQTPLAAAEDAIRKTIFIICLGLYFDQLQAEDGEDATSPTPGKTFHVFLSYFSSNSYSHTLSDDELADSDKDNVQSSHGTLAILAQFFTFQSNMFMLF